jgi:hypothetical protein
MLSIGAALPQGKILGHLCPNRLHYIGWGTLLRPPTTFFLINPHQHHFDNCPLPPAGWYTSLGALDASRHAPSGQYMVSLVVWSV